MVLTHGNWQMAPHGSESTHKKSKWRRKTVHAYTFGFWYHSSVKCHCVYIVEETKKNLERVFHRTRFSFFLKRWVNTFFFILYLFLVYNENILVILFVLIDVRAIVKWYNTDIFAFYSKASLTIYWIHYSNFLHFV